MPIPFVIKQEIQTAEIYSGGVCLDTSLVSSSIPGSAFGKVFFCKKWTAFFTLNSRNTT